MKGIYTNNILLKYLVVEYLSLNAPRAITKLRISKKIEDVERNFYCNVLHYSVKGQLTGNLYHN